MHEAYSSGLLVWHVYCDKRSVLESLQAPTHHSHIISFVTSLVGAYSGSAISNYLYGLRDWHLLHCMDWKLNTLEIEALLKRVAKLALDSSPRQSYTLDFITKVSKKLDLHLRSDAAIYACLSISFYSVAWVSEVMVPWLNAFDPMKHITPANLQTSSNQYRAEVTVLHIPHTKAAPLKGEDIYWSCHPSPTNPYEALANHRQINRPGDSNHFFTYHHKGKLRPLTKHTFIRQVADAAHAAGLNPLQGHGIQIGATLFNLLRGTPFEAVKVMGQWSSDAFLRYLRKYDQILAPYIRVNPDIHHSFSHFIMPSQATLQGHH